MDKISGYLGAFVILIAGALFVSFLLSWPVMMLWNGCLVPAVDGIHKIEWLQAQTDWLATGLGTPVPDWHPV